VPDWILEQDTTEQATPAGNVRVFSPSLKAKYFFK
jgi:hypothetical protein